MNRSELVSLYTASIVAFEKVQRNANKLSFMSMTKNNVHAFETYGHQLEAYQIEAMKARDAFTKAAFTLSSQEVVSIINEANEARA